MRLGYRGAMWLATLALRAEAFHGVRLVDPDGAPFGCVDLETVNHLRFRTDDDGVAAIDEPGLMGEPVWLTPFGPTVEAPVDWLGIPGFQVVLTEGEQDTVVLDRIAPEADCPLDDLSTRLQAHGTPIPSDTHELDVIDRQTGRPVPAVRLTALGREWWTDNGGRVAFFELDGMDETVRFEVWTHGYTHDPGYVDLVPVPGAVTTIELDRVNLAERLVRLTGGGTWVDTVRLGLPTPLAEPLLDGEVLGQDTAHAVEWRGGLFWLWGDTNVPSYPLGNFHTTGALAPLDPTPEDGVDLEYLVDAAGYPRGIAPTFPEGPVWLSGLVALDDEELWATFVNVRADFTPLHDGMVRWSDARQQFELAVEYDDATVIRPGGPAFRFDGPDGSWVMYRNLARAPADRESLADPSTYQSYTPLVPNGAGGFTVATAADGTPDWQWRSGAPAPQLGDDLIPTPWSAVDPDSGEEVAIHQGTIAWNPWRGRWLHVFTQSFGSSSLIGEIWYAEGDTPVGPWSWARKIITHDGYSFYNPYFHPWFASEGGRRVLFEGTYTAWLGDQPPTPRHDYNQLLYALDLDAPGVAVPVPFYGSVRGPVPRHDAALDAAVAFGALESPGPDRTPIRWTGPDCAARRLDPQGAGEVAFHALPAGSVGPGLVDLVEWTRPDGSLTWSTGPVDDAVEGPAVAAVWSARWAPPVPLSLYPLPDRADAGPDQCAAASPVRLDGSASVLAGGIESWSWSWPGGSASGESPSVELAPGVHVVALTVSGPGGDAVDVVVIDVAAGTGPTDPTTDSGTPPPGADGGPAPAEGCGCGPTSTPTATATGWVVVLGLAIRARARRPARPQRPRAR